jgi:hypothetical protein
VSSQKKKREKKDENPSDPGEMIEDTGEDKTFAKVAEPVGSPNVNLTSVLVP